MSGSQRVPIELIARGIRIRDISPEAIGPLAESIKEVGLLNPITVRPYTFVISGKAVDGYMLVSGLHRLEAAVKLGWTEIEATISPFSRADAIIAECDENLCRPDLSASVRALFTRTRKEAYEEKHPETRHGENQHTRVRQLGNSTTETNRFTADTAAKTGQSERVVQRDAKRGQIAPQILAQIKGTKLDKGVVLDRIAAHPDPADQLAAVEQERERAEAPRSNGKMTDRAAVAAEPLWPVPQLADRSEMPRFLGWTRYEWAAAPRELIEHVGLVDAWERWKAEEADMQDQIRRGCAAIDLRIGRQESFTPEEIVIPQRFRDVIPSAVDALVESIGKIGLQTPITVRWAKEGNDDIIVLVAGRHRLEACIRVSMPLIECEIFEGSEIDARLWEIAENLHSTGLSALERAEHAEEWLRLTQDKMMQPARVSVNGKRHGSRSQRLRHAGVRL
jgi:ParB family chromosome partitioning protein